MTMIRTKNNPKKQPLRCDCHTHILPGMDDGAKTAEMSLEMLKITQDYGVETVLLTPHYYASAESIEAFLQRRESALETLRQACTDVTVPRMVCGAEVHLEEGVSADPLLKELCIGDSGYLLLEMPYFSFNNWMLEEAENICYRHGLKLILAHLSRYISYYSEAELQELLTLPDVIVQVNAEDMLYRPARKLVEKWFKNDVPLLFGSDCHNLTTRRPNLDAAAAHIGKSYHGFSLADDSNALAEEFGWL